MALRRIILKLLYPVTTFLTRKEERGIVIENVDKLQPSNQFYKLEAMLNDGRRLSFEHFRGKKVLIVNTASDCGYTHQYKELEKLYKQYKVKLEIIAFPSNEFGNQESGNDAEIAAFCRQTYQVTFPIAGKSIVTRNNKQNTVYKWLTYKQENGWNDHVPKWNFYKYLVNEEGVLTHYFGSAVRPFDERLTNAINR